MLGKTHVARDRQIERGYIYVSSACLSILGGIQPGVIAAFVRSAIDGGQGEDGLLQRFQFLVWPDLGTEYKLVDRRADSALQSRAFEVYQHLDGITVEGCGAQRDIFEGDPVGRPYLHFDSDAQAMFYTWLIKLERSLRHGKPLSPFESHIAKFKKLIPSIALLLHLAEGYSGPVGVASLEKALRWEPYLRSHAMRIYNSAPAAVYDAANLILERVKTKGLGLKDFIVNVDRVDFPVRGFTARDVYNRRWAGLGGKELVQEALELLEENDWLMSFDVRQATGRPTTVYAVNPALTAQTA